MSGSFHVNPNFSGLEVLKKRYLIDLFLFFVIIPPLKRNPKNDWLTGGDF
jgi:hypothetical protein